jgi:hypothetical protein
MPGMFTGEIRILVNSYYRMDYEKSGLFNIWGKAVSAIAYCNGCTEPIIAKCNYS